MPEDAMLEKIKKLMALAERAGTRAEAELAFAKGQALMTKYAIDEATLSLSRLGKDVDIIDEFVSVGTDGSCQTLFNIVAKNNNCACVIVSTGYYDKSGKWRMRADKMRIFGTRSDIEFTKMLYASLLMFCEHSLMLMREIAPERYKGKTVSYNYRLGFATGVGAKMRMAKEETVKESEPGTELVLVSRKEHADAAKCNEYPKLKSKALSIRNMDAYNKGLKRGTQANVSGGRNNLGSGIGEISG